MSYIIMAVDECGSETRPDFPAYPTRAAATKNLPEARERYPEYRRIWAEELRDKDFYMMQRSDAEFFDHPEDQFLGNGYDDY